MKVICIRNWKTLIPDIIKWCFVRCVALWVCIFFYRYFKDFEENEPQEESEDLYSFWHHKLAEFFDHCEDLDRKAEVPSFVNILPSVLFVEFIMPLKNMQKNDMEQIYDFFNQKIILKMGVKTTVLAYTAIRYFWACSFSYLNSWYF